ncbi:MAG TPA: hypothetical protein P5318_19520 [Candidatus Hydrogenedentes bacterium]|nr:hypothetical protein [Candidatus Hydrogenedentota bacterium]
MWIFTSHGMLSVVAHRTQPDDLLVRAREPGVIEALFPEAKVKTTPNADYRYRAAISRGHVAVVLANKLFRLGYTNFKASISASKQAYNDACMDVWSRMSELQNTVDRK